MKKRKLGPIVLATALGIGAGCQRHFAQAANPMLAAAPVAAPTTPAPFTTPPVLPGTPDVATLVAKVTPAVVNITTIHDIKAPQQEFEFPFGFDPFGVFPGMGRRPGGGGKGGGDQVFRQRALGSGFIVDGPVMSSPTRTSSKMPTRCA
jgi:S1-C subfamily serine protease